MNLSMNLRNTAQQHGDTIAIRFAEMAITYNQLDAQVDQFAAGLLKLGLKQGSRVAILLGNSPQFMIAYYALARIGAISIPINPLYTPGEMQYILSDAAAEAVVAVAPLAPAFQMMKATLPALQHVILVGGGAEGAIKFAEVFADANGLPQPDISDQDIAVILYTSGTTGKPKGAMLSHGNVCSNASHAGDFLGMTKEDTVVAVLPMFHVFCMTVCMNAPLYRGATILVMPRFSPVETAHVVRDLQATVFVGVPTMYNYLLQHPECLREDLKTVRLSISGGAAMPIAVLQGFEQKFGVAVSEGYGLSEASPVVCFNPIDRVRKPGTVGVAIPGVEVRAVREDGVDCGPNEVGELIVRGPNVMLGYLNRPEDSAQTLKEGWLYTGDLVSIDDDGYVTIVDRKKDMIIVGGFNVYPREVEEVLFGHPAVAEAAVIGVPDVNRGEAVKAFVSLKDPSVTVEELLAYCKDNLAKYKIPAEFDIVDELPKNSTGKILRRALKSQNPSQVK